MADDILWNLIPLWLLMLMNPIIIWNGTLLAQCIVYLDECVYLVNHHFLWTSVHDDFQYISYPRWPWEAVLLPWCLVWDWGFITDDIYPKCDWAQPKLNGSLISFYLLDILCVAQRGHVYSSIVNVIKNTHNKSVGYGYWRLLQNYVISSTISFSRSLQSLPN